MRTTYRQDPETKKFITLDEYVAKYGLPESRVSTHTNIIEDIKPFMSPIDNKMVTSRKQLRHHNKLHGVIQVGNDWNRPKKQEYKPAPGLKETIIENVKKAGIIS